MAGASAMADVMTMDDDGSETQWKTEAGPALAPIGENGPATALGAVTGLGVPQMTRPGTASGMMASRISVAARCGTAVHPLSCLLTCARTLSAGRRAGDRP